MMIRTAAAIAAEASIYSSQLHTSRPQLSLRRLHTRTTSSSSTASAFQKTVSIQVPPRSRAGVHTEIVFCAELKVLAKSLVVSPLLRRRKRHESFRASATARPVDIGEDDAAGKTLAEEENGAAPTGMRSWVNAFREFSRPHTVIGSAIGVISISTLAIQSPRDVSVEFFQGLLQALVPALLMNIYIVGLNQIYDVDIDKVNKPYLPLASGEFSMQTGIAIVTVSALTSLGTGFLVKSQPLLWTLFVSLILGTAYSVDVPFLRWKRSAVAAASCILAIRAVVVQLGFYYHMQGFVLGRAPGFTRQLAFATAFMSFISLVIALAKDLPDVEGDKVYGIRSFSVRLGQERVFWACVWLIQAAYAVAMVVGAASPSLLAKVAMIVGHAGFSRILWAKARATNLTSKTDIVSFYMFIWRLFYAEYLIIPFVR